MTDRAPFGRLLLSGQLVKQSHGYHSYAKLLLIFSPFGDSDHCLIEDADFSAELRRGTLDGLARAREELGLKGMVVLCTAETHAVDSHRQDFEQCAFATAKLHLEQSALRTPPVLDTPEELLQFWQDQWLCLLASLRHKVRAALIRLGFSPQEDRDGTWLRQRGRLRETVRLVSHQMSRSVDLILIYEQPPRLAREWEGIRLSRLSGRGQSWLLESATCLQDLLQAFHEVMPAQVARSADEILQSLGKDMDWT